MSLIGSQNRKTTPIPTLHLQFFSTLAHHRKDSAFPGWKPSLTILLRMSLAQTTSTGDSRFCPYIKEDELFRMFQHVRLELDEHFVKPWVLIQRFQGPTFPFLLNASVVFYQGHCEITEVD